MAAPVLGSGNTIMKENRKTFLWYYKDISMGRRQVTTKYMSGEKARFGEYKTVRVDSSDDGICPGGQGWGTWWVESPWLRTETDRQD